MSKALTLAKKKNVKKFRTHGFLARMSTAGGRKTILSRLRKGRSRLTVQ